MPVMSITAVAFVVIFAFLGVPIAVALGLGTSLTLFIFQPTPLTTIVQQVWSGIEIYALVAVPFFILAGTLMEKLGAAKVLVDFSNSFIGWTKGGLGSVNIIASFIFGGVSGSSISDTAALGTLLIPRMEEEGYGLEYSSAVTLASSTLAVIVPPSIPMLLYGVVAEQSVGRLLIGGVIPGALFAGLMLLYNFYIAEKRGYGTQTAFNLKNLISISLRGIPALGAPLIVIGSIITGFVTPSEAGGLAALYVLISSIFYSDFSWTKVKDSLIQSMTLSAGILFIVANARLFTWLLVMEDVPAYFVTLLKPLASSPALFMIAVSVILFFVGMFIDLSIAILVFAPLFLPFAKLAGLDPIHFGVIFVVSLAMGLITPPFGLCLYSVCLVSGIDVVSLTKSTIPFYILMFAGILLLIFFPGLVLYLPGLIAQ